MVTLDSTIEAKPLHQGISAQKAELIALQTAAEIDVNIYTDSKYAFTTLHVHGALYKEKALINSGEKGIKYGQKILNLLNVYGHSKKNCRYTLLVPPKKGNTVVAQGNPRKDREAK